MESAMSGILAGRNAVRRAEGKPTGCPNGETMSGALSRYISDESVKHFQPMGANFGILPPMEPKIRDKKERYAACLTGRWRHWTAFWRNEHEDHCRRIWRRQRTLGDSKGRHAGGGHL